MHAGEVDSLVLAQQPTMHDLSNDVAPLNCDDAQFHRAIVEEDAVARMDIASETHVRRADAFCRAVHWFRCDAKWSTVLEHDGQAPEERAGADLRPLQVLHDGDRLVERFGCPADAVEVRGVLV